MTHELIQELEAKIDALHDLHERIVAEVGYEEATGLEEGISWLRGCQMTLAKFLRHEKQPAAK